MTTIANSIASIEFDLANIATVKTAELVATHNIYAEKAVKKFSDRKTAERRTREVLESALADLRALEAVAPEVEAEPVKRSLSESIAASWTNPEVAAKRLTRHAVVARVGGKALEFASLRKAFAALKLPDSKHIAFRQVLKAKGKATFNFGRDSVEFELAEINEENFE
ncbi:hypothetical protein CPT_MyoSmar_001 [Serratia phage MyoSmar]|jgi:hypothetical protein|uniref:Uncharacterized protein n=3 Tax=Myosmarvirus TaxID=2843428 RepID=A0A9E8JXG0_9CAUD|nr:hypothetical protein HWC56_gp001 [Serratia phage MyoSmar]QEG09450.1 hypothetical protein CPT_MyoSmar_001 [Serratia phage MyoSmar]UZS00390.1 hypothetical protein [Serratia phage SMP]